MAITDWIVLSLSVFLLIRGAFRGFMHSLLGPVSVIAATILSIAYYQDTKNMIISLLIGLIGPLFLSLLLKIILKAWANTDDTGKKPNFFSCLGGSILTFVWGWVFIIFTLILLAVLPPLGAKLTTIHNDVVQSKSYAVARPFEDIFFAASKQSTPAATGSTLNFDAKSLAEDPRFQQVLQDPEIQKEVNAHDFVKLMSNPKMMALTQEIMNDPATMKKIMSLYNRQTSPQKSLK